MHEKTRRGIYYDFEKSPYRSTYGALTFVFSSENNRARFEDRIDGEIAIYNQRQTERAKMPLKSKAIFFPAITLYNKIESRGFLIMGNMFGYEWTWTRAADVIIADIPEIGG